MSLQTFASFPGGAISAHIDRELLMIAKKNVIFQQLGTQCVMPAGEGKTFQFNRYERLALPKVPLTEGVPPASTNMTLTTVQAVSDQWGAFVEISDVALLTIMHPLLQVAIDLLGYQAAELVDREVINVLLSGTSVTYCGSATTRAGLTTIGTDSLTDAVLQKCVARLRSAGAHPYEGTNFVGVLDPAMEQDISQNSNNAFTLAAAYSNAKLLYNGEIGMWRGVRWMTSNFIPTITGVAAESYTSPSSPAGTFAAASYRVSTGYYDAGTGFLVQLSQNSAVAFAALDSLGGTTPNDSAYIYKIFVGLAAGGATAIMYQGVETTYGTDFIPANTAFSIVDPPVAGVSIAGSNIPATSAIVHIGWIFGKQAYAVVDLMNLKTFVSKAEATTADPLVQKRTVGYKLMFKPAIQNDSFMMRFEGLSAFN